MGLSQSFVNLVREQNEDYTISLIQQKKVDIFARDDEERTALHWASAEGKKKKFSVFSLLVILIATNYLVELNSLNELFYFLQFIIF